MSLRRITRVGLHKYTPAFFAGTSKGFEGKDLASAIKDRRTYYSINKEVKVSDKRVREIVEYAVKWCPSSFNCQSSRSIILLGKHHDKFWNATRDILKKIVPAEKFGPTEAKMTGFQGGYGTILFFEDQNTVQAMKDKFPLYAHHFSSWSEQASGMLQFAIWSGLETEGLGASLQHYNPLVDETVQREWGAPPNWKLMSQMVFGNPTQGPGEKTFLPIEDRVKFFN